MALTQSEEATKSPAAGAPPTSLVDAWQRRVRRQPDTRAIAYFDGSMSVGQLDEASNALAAAFASLGVRRGDRVGIYLQNVPQYALSFMALWKLGSTALLLNPMHRGEELRHLVDDSGAVGVVCADVDVDETAKALAGSSVGWLVRTSPLAFQSRNDPRVFPDIAPPPVPTAAAHDLEDLLEEFRGAVVSTPPLAAHDVALLTYTSGTTGPPKGAMNTHGNLLAATSTFADWVGLEPGGHVPLRPGAAGESLCGLNAPEEAQVDELR